MENEMPEPERDADMVAFERDRDYEMACQDADFHAAQ